MMLFEMQKDAVILVADKNIEFAVRGLLSKHHALGISNPLVADIYVHPERDPGCFLEGANFLRPFINSYKHALIIFDREGSGREDSTREELEHDVEGRLEQTGWGGRTMAIALDPELEIWVWSDSPHVARILGWENKQPDIKSWLEHKGYLTGQDIKPNRPKEALEEALRLASKARSSALYFELAKSVSFERCSDPAFAKFKSGLQRWFSATREPNSN